MILLQLLTIYIVLGLWYYTNKCMENMDSFKEASIFSIILGFILGVFLFPLMILLGHK
jgi:ethanolamine transporter EutH